MKILFFAPESDRPNGEGAYGYHNIRAPLLAMGHEIIDVDFRGELKRIGRDELGRHVRALIDRERPDIFLHMVFEDELAPEIARDISQHTSTISVAFFSDDDWRLDHSLGVIPHYNVGLTTAKQAVPIYQRAGFSHVILTQYAANTDLYHPLDGVPRRYDVAFVGQAYRGRPEMIAWLRERGVDVRVWGQGWERVPALRGCAGGFLPHAELLNVFAASKIVLGMSWTSDAKALQIKGRIFEYAAAGAFQLSTQDDRLADYFDVGREIVLYRNQEDLLEKIRHYLAHEEERTAIAGAAHARVLKEHTWTQRFEQIFDAINRQLPAGKRLLQHRGTARTTGTSVRAALPQRPTVSVLCTVYNGERYLAQTVESVLDQEFTDWELVLFDDGSTDGTRDIVMRYAKDPRVRYLHHANIAQGGTAFDKLLNTCLDYLRGEYVAFIGADDLFLPEKLAVQMAEAAADPAIDVVFSDGMHIDAAGQRLPSDFRFPEAQVFTSRSLLRTLFRKNIVPHPTALIKREAIDRLGGFETGFCPDYQFWLKAARFLRFKYIDRKLVQYRIHGQGISTGPASRTLPETAKLLALMRERVTIQDLYPELDACRDKTAALYSAYTHLGLSCLTANIPSAQLAFVEFQRALEHRGDGIEAINNLGVTLALLGAHGPAEQCFQFRPGNVPSPPALAHNLAVLRELAANAGTKTQGFMLLAEPTETTALLRALDPPADIPVNPHSFGGLIASVQVCAVDTPRPAVRVGAVPGTQPAGERLSAASAAGENSGAPARTPMVSVIMPTHNRPQQLRRAVESVLAQTYQDFEIIVINDAGREVEADLAGMNAAGRITYARHAVNRGLAAARNSGLRLARGKYIAYLDDDDRFLPDHLETLVTLLETHRLRAAYSDAWRVHEQLQGNRYVEVARDMPYSYDFDAARLLISNYFPVLTVMHERACLEDAGLFDESLTSHEDWDLWIRISRRDPFTHVKKVTAEFTWRTDGSSMTSGHRPDFARTAAIIYEKYRAASEAVPGVRAMQERAMREFHALLEAAPAFTCSIIIPVWNKVELTKQCLTALASATTDVSFEVILVDNGSTDGTKEFLAELQGDVRIIRNEENLGFAKACNQGARAARGKYLVFLNNDTIPEPHWLKPLVSEVDEHPEVGIVGSKLLFADGSVQHAGVVFMRSHLSAYHVYRSASNAVPAVNQRREFQAVTAACMLIRREVFEEAGGFDEGFINGFEDVDLCLKVREKGHHVIYQPRSVVYHLESQTPGRNDRDEHNARLLEERWGDHWWLGDEDLHYHTDGLKLVGGPQDIKFATQLKPMTDVRDRAAWAHVAAAQAAALKKDWAAVKRELRLADDWPNDRFVLSWGAMVAERLQEPIYRTRFLSRYLALVDAPAERLALARTLLEQNNLPGAEEHLRILLAAAPDHAEGLLLKGILCMQREQYREAERAFSSALRQGADRRKCLMGMGMASLGHAYHQGAWERFLQVLGEHPDDAEAVHWLLRAGTAQNRWDELSRQLRQYLSRNPADLAARFALAGVLVRAEQIEAARQEYETLRALAPTYDGLAELGQAIAGKEAVVAMEAAHS